jgi:hypothetical protein
MGIGGMNLARDLFIVSLFCIYINLLSVPKGPLIYHCDTLRDNRVLDDLKFEKRSDSLGVLFSVHCAVNVSRYFMNKTLCYCTSKAK